MREAIISLEIGGLVEVRIGTGIFVTASAASAGTRDRDVGPGPFELLNARKLIEGEIAALAAANASEHDIEGMRQTVKRMESNVDDFGVRSGMRIAYGLEAMPGKREMLALAEPWRPYRSVASWYLWRVPAFERAARPKPAAARKTPAIKKPAAKASQS